MHLITHNASFGQSIIIVQLILSFGEFVRKRPCILQINL